MHRFEFRHGTPMSSNPLEHGATLVHEPSSPRSPHVFAKLSRRDAGLNASVNWQAPGFPDHSCSGQDDDDPWGFRGPIFGR
jgi:hypothetical protein